MCVGCVGEELLRACGEEPPPEPPTVAKGERGSSRFEEEPHWAHGEGDMVG
jgi:hypothetical protein